MCLLLHKNFAHACSLNMDVQFQYVFTSIMFFEGLSFLTDLIKNTDMSVFLCCRSNCINILVR